MTKAVYSLDPAKRTQLGVIVLQADETLEQDFRRLIPQEVEYMISRVPSGTSVTPGTLRAMAGNLTAAAQLFPAGADLSCVAYACTSGTAAIGPQRISDLVRQGVQTPVVTDPVTALLSACRALDVRRVGLVSPYIASVSDTLRDVLDAAGITVTRLISFDEPNEAAVVRIAGQSLCEAALQVVDKGGCDAVFLSCTNLRTLDIIAGIEAATQLPVLSSNLVLAWHMLSQVGHTLPSDMPYRLATPGATRRVSSR